MAKEDVEALLLARSTYRGLEATADTVAFA